MCVRVCKSVVYTTLHQFLLHITSYYLYTRVHSQYNTKLILLRRRMLCVCVRVCVHYSYITYNSFYHSWFHIQIATFQSDDSPPPTNSLMLPCRQKTTLVPRPCTCERCGITCGCECRTGDSESHCSVANMRTEGSSRDVVAVAGFSGKACEYGLDNHYATGATPSHESHNRAPPSIVCNNTTIVPKLVASKLRVPVLPTMLRPNPGVLPIITAYYKAASLLNGKDKGNKNNDLITNGNSATHTRDNSHCQLSGFQLWKCLKACECVCLFEKTLLLVLIGGAQKAKSDLCQGLDNECTDSGGSSSSGQGSGGGSSGGGKKQQNSNSNRSGSSSSSSQQSGSGSSQRGGGGGTGMGGGRNHSGSSGDSSDDNGDDDHNKRPPRQQPNKEPKAKIDFDDDDDDEATDSADEGEDTPRSMTVDISPQSVQNDNGGSMSSHGGGGVGGAGGGAGEGGGGGKGQDGGAGRGRSNISSLPLLGGSGTSSSRFSTSLGGGATVEAITLKEGMAGGSIGGVSGASSGRITTATLVSSSQINSPVNMAVGYGVPVLAAAEGDGLMAAASSSMPSSELGTPTMDSPSPPPLGGRATPGTPPAMSPEITPNPQVGK